MPSSLALTQSANREWLSLLRPHRCRGLLNPMGGRERWVSNSVDYNNMKMQLLKPFYHFSLAALSFSVSATLFTPFFPSFLHLPSFSTHLGSICHMFNNNPLGTQTKPCLSPPGLLLRPSCTLFLPLCCSSLLVRCCRSFPPQFQMAHLVPLKPYAAPVPRSQSLCDQPTKTMSAFPTQDPSLTPTPRPIHSRELVRQNSDPTSETPAPQAHQMVEDRGPWIRLPDVELPPKVRSCGWFCLCSRCPDQKI